MKPSPFLSSRANRRSRAAWNSPRVMTPSPLVSADSKILPGSGWRCLATARAAIMQPELSVIAAAMSAIMLNVFISVSRMLEGLHNQRLQLLLESPAEVGFGVGHVLHAQNRVVAGVPIDPRRESEGPGR